MGWWSVPSQTELIVGGIPLDRIGNLLEEPAGDISRIFGPTAGG